MDENVLIKKINALKKKMNAVILVHNYQVPEIYPVADFIGDSLNLSRKAASTDKDIIVFSGVKFMAETAKILSPTKLVLLPELGAGCPMADMIKVEDVMELRKRYPKAAVACYVNTTADVKAACDVCITSANAVKVINSLKEDQVIVVPDKNLAAYIAKNTKKEIIGAEGFCYVHERMSPEDVVEARKKLPHATIIVHPECRPEVIALADHVASTSAMIELSRKAKSKDIIIGTEIGMIERLKIEVPEKRFYSLGAAKICHNMKMTSLQSIYDALLKKQHEITVDKKVAEGARKSLQRMLDVV